MQIKHTDAIFYVTQGGLIIMSEKLRLAIEKFDNKSFLIEIYNDGIFSLRNIFSDNSSI